MGFQLDYRTAELPAVDPNHFYFAEQSKIEMSLSSHSIEKHN